MHGARLLGLDLSAEQVRTFQQFYQELVAWNEKVNLTAITGYEEVQVKHFLDALTVVPTIEEMLDGKDAGIKVMDIGSGAGLPGIPLSIVLPSANFVLMDSIGKKTAFLQHVVDRLGLNNVRVLTGRAEDFGHQPDYREKFDLVVSRALGKLAAVIELSLSFGRLHGLIIAQKKGDITDEVQQAGKSLEMMGGRLKELRGIEMEELANHNLVIVEKVAATPSKYPRRPGMPAKRPL